MYAAAGVGLSRGDESGHLPFPHSPSHTQSECLCLLGPGVASCCRLSPPSPCLLRYYLALPNLPTYLVRAPSPGRCMVHMGYLHCKARVHLSKSSHNLPVLHHCTTVPVLYIRVYGERLLAAGLHLLHCFWKKDGQDGQDGQTPVCHRELTGRWRWPLWLGLATALMLVERLPTRQPTSPWWKNAAHFCIQDASHPSTPHARQKLPCFKGSKQRSCVVDWTRAPLMAVQSQQTRQPWRPGVLFLAPSASLLQYL